MNPFIFYIVISYLFIYWIKDLPSSDSLFNDVPKYLFDQIPQTLSTSEQRKHEKFLSKSKNNKNTQPISSKIMQNRDHISFDTEPMENEGKYSLW